MEAVVRHRITEISESVPSSIGDMMHFQLLNCDPEKGDYTMSCETAQWMRNFAGTLHGGLCATILDQAGESHRQGDVVSVTKSLMNLTAEAVQASHPDKICLSGSGIYFCKPAQ